MAQSRPTSRPKTITLEPGAPPSDAPDGDSTSDEAANIMELIRAAQSAGGGEDFKVRVYQYAGPNKLGVSMPYVTSCTVEEIESLPEQLAEVEPAGGRFQVRVTRAGRMFKQFEVEVAPRPAGLIKQPQQQNTSDVTALAGIMREMMDENRRFMAQMMERAPPSAVAPQNTMGGMTEMLAFAKTMREAFPAPEPNIGLGMFEKGMEMANKIYDMRGGDKESGLLDIARDLIAGEGGQKLLGTIAEGMANKPGRQPMHAPAQAFRPMQGQRGQVLRGPVNQQPAPQPAPMAQPQPKRSATPVKDALEQIISEAKKGSDPGFVADTIEAQLPDGIMAFLERQPDIFAYLAGIDPRVKEHEDFFKAVIAAIWVDEETESGQGAEVARGVSTA